MRRGSRGRGYGGGGRPPALHRPQNNIPRQLQPPQSHSGPVISDSIQLQGLKDIDMELELLKRKREIIEQQQQMLTSSYRQRNDYEQPVFNQPRQSRYDDYTRLYNNPRESEQYGGRGGNEGGRGGHGAGNRKRPHIPVWENEIPTKRFSAPSSRGKKSFGSRPGPAQPPRPAFQRPPEPLMQSKPPKRPPPPPQKKKEFNPSKVSKPTAAPPLKLASYQPAERKRLVTEAVASGAVRPAAVDDALVLRADREPSHLMRGRLELTLGAIMKDVKTANPQHEQLFKQMHVARAMKQCVRDRIRTAMVGKPVSGTEQIKLAYYEMFPPGNDDGVITRGLMAQDNKDFIYFDTANPEAYFKKNMRTLMLLKMEEMVNKLQEIYVGAATRSTKQQRQRNYKPKSKQQPQADTEGAPTEAQPAKPQTGETQGVDNAVPKTEDIVAENPKTEDAVAENPKTEDAVAENTKTEGAVAENTTTEDNVAEKPITEDVAENLGWSETETKLNDTETAVIEIRDNVQEEANTSEAAEAQLKAEVVKLASAPNIPTITIPKELIDNEQYQALDKLMTYKILHLIRRYSPEFVKVMEIDAMYRKIKHNIFGETNKKLSGKLKNKQSPTEVAQSGTDAAQSAPLKKIEKVYPQMYFVKILGKPALPKRKAMEYFFDQFKPKTIKKHRTIHNLLFVGFIEKEPYEKILAADGTAIGRFTLDIKVSERIDPKKNNNTESSTKEKLNDSTDNIIGTDLDDQITDLLSSIRNSDTDNFAEDIVMAEPPTTQDANEVIDCDADQNANNLSGDDDVIQFKDVPQNDDTEVEGDDQIEDGPSDDVTEVNDDVTEVNDDVTEVNDDVTEVNDDDEEVVEIKDGQDTDVVEVNNQTTPVKGTETLETEKKDSVGALKSDVKDLKATPTRASARLATPGGIRTRRMSKLTE